MCPALQIILLKTVPPSQKVFPSYASGSVVGIPKAVYLNSAVSIICSQFIFAWYVVSFEQTLKS